MAKAAAILTIFSYCTYLGLAGSRRLIRRERLLLAIQSAARQLLFSMGQTRLPLKDLLLQSGYGAAQPLMHALGEAVAAGASTEAAWEEAKARLQKTGALEGLTQADMEMMDGFFPALGRSDLAGQQENGRLLLRQLTEALAAASSDRAVRGKLYRALGPLMGAAFALLMM